MTTQTTPPPAQADRTTPAFIISFVAAILIIFVGSVLVWQSYVILRNPILQPSPALTAYQTTFMTLGTVGLICGTVVMVGAVLIRTPGKRTVGGVLTITFSLISIVGLGGYIIGLLLGTIGGALALAGPKRATFGFAVSAVAGILTFIWGMAAIDRAINPSYGWGSIVDFRPTAPVWLARVDGGILGAVEILCAVMVIIGAVLIFMPGKEKIGATIVIVFSVIGFISLGSSAVINILGIIGGALGIAKK